MKRWMLSLKIAIIGLALILAPGCGPKDGPIVLNGVSGPYFNVLNGQVLVTMKFPNLNIDAGIKIPIPETRNCEAELAPNAIDGGMMLTLYIGLEDLKAVNIGVGDGNTLPDGRPLPGVQGGVLKNSLRLDTKIGKQDVSFYFHKNLFGVWMPFGFDTAGLGATYNFRLGGKVAGFIGIVGSDPQSGLKAGGILMLQLNNVPEARLNKILELSRRNPHIMY